MQTIIISMNTPTIPVMTRETKEKYSVSKESNKFANQTDHTLEEIDINAPKNIKRSKSSWM